MGDNLGRAKERAAPVEVWSSDAVRGFQESSGARWTPLFHFLEHFSKIYILHVFSEQVTFPLACGEEVRLASGDRGVGEVLLQWVTLCSGYADTSSSWCPEGLYHGN